MADLINPPPMRFHTGMARSPEEAFWKWREVAGVFFDVALASPEALSSFHIDMESHDLGGVVINRIAASGQTFRRSAFTIARTGFDHYLVQLYRRGGYVGHVDGDPIEVRPGDTCILDMAHTLHTFADDFENITLVLPRATLAPLVRAPHGLNGIVLAGGSPRGALIAQHLSVLCAQAGGLTRADLPPIIQATALLVAACAGPDADRRAAHGGRAHAPSITLIRRFIELNLASDTLSPETLSQQFGVSRPTLYRLFEPFGGVATYIRRRRLERCFQEITAPARDRRRIAEIAYGWGFRNEAAFSRSFRQAFGVSAREARLAGAERAGSMAAQAQDGEADVPATTRWIRRL